MKGNLVSGRMKLLVSLICLLLAVGLLHRAFADTYPSRPIEFIVPWGPGGGSDQTARMLGKLLEERLKVSFPIINVPGATGNVGMAKFLSAPADGYTICILAWDTLAQVATLSPKWKVTDFVPLAIVIQLPSAIYVSQNSRFKTWADVEKEARTKPNALKIAISGYGSPDDITVGYFASKGIKLVAVPYAKPGERYAAVLGGHVDLLYSPMGNIKGLVETQQLRPLLILDKQRFPGFESVPASVEFGYNITLPQRRAIIIKANTDPQRIKLLSDMLAQVAAGEKYKNFLKEQLARQDSYLPTDEALKVMQEDVEHMKEIVAATKAQK